jgi:hypothetical protein
MRRLSFVTTGLDPVVHAEAQRCMDCRTKSGNDARERSRGVFAPEVGSTEDESSGLDPVRWPPAVGPASISIVSGARKQEGGTPADA